MGSVKSKICKACGAKSLGHVICKYCDIPLHNADKAKTCERCGKKHTLRDEVFTGYCKECVLRGRHEKIRHEPDKDKTVMLKDL